MSRVTYPHLGTLYITSEHFFRTLGLEPVTPPFPSRRTLDLGVKHCPEMTCAPCKILFGNYYEGLELGADRLVLFGGPDTCRLGYLARPQAEQLRDTGFRFTPHTLSLRGIAADILRVARELADPSPLELVEAARTLSASLSLVDEIEQQSFSLRPRERERGLATRLRAEALPCWPMSISVTMEAIHASRALRPARRTMRPVPLSARGAPTCAKRSKSARTVKC